MARVTPREKKTVSADVGQKGGEKDDHRPPEIGLSPEVPGTAAGRSQRARAQLRRTRERRHARRAPPWCAGIGRGCELQPRRSQGRTATALVLLRLARARRASPRAQSTRSTGNPRTARAEQRPGVDRRRIHRSAEHARSAGSAKCGEHHEREDEQRRYDAPRSSGPCRIGRSAVDRRGVRSCVLETGRGQAIEMPGRATEAAVHPPTSPRAGHGRKAAPELDRATPSGRPTSSPELIAVPPRRRSSREGFEHLHGLRRWDGVTESPA